MNNEQFRRLVLEKPTPKSNKLSSPSGNNRGPADQNAARPSIASGALGSRMRSNIPMTPRTLTAPDFARQLADYRREQGGEHRPAKKFKSSAAPKGTKLPTGYLDRAAQLRTGDASSDGGSSALSAGDDIETRIQALEEMVKLGQIDEETFTKLRSELGVGGDIKSTHMIKGLDWDLLRRVRAGEDVSQAEEKENSAEREGEAAAAVDVDEELERALEEIPAAPRGKEEEKKKKKGNMAPPPVAGSSTKRKTRDEILRELKASRAAAAAAAAATEQPSEPALGARFKKIADPSKLEKKRFVEKDESGRRREVLLITDAEGKTKRKVRWLDKPGVTVPSREGTGDGLLVPGKDAKPLGMEVPVEIASKMNASLEAEDEDDDIFAGVGADYNPLADLGEDDESSSDSDEDGEVNDEEKRDVSVSEATKVEAAVHKPRNYFATGKEVNPTTTDDRSNPLMKDPVLLAAFKKAATLRQTSPSAAEGEEPVDRDTALRRKKFLEEANRQEALDAMDMDLGFGSSRIEDDEDDEEVVLEGNRGAKKRKRGPKKKKGDKDSAADVMSVLEGRKR